MNAPFSVPAGFSMADVGKYDALPSFDGLTPLWLADLLKMGGTIGGQQQPMPPMASAPAVPVQIGGGQFVPAYHPSMFAPRPTAQALSGLLGGVM